MQTPSSKHKLAITGPTIELGQLIQLRHMAKHLQLKYHYTARSSLAGKYRSHFRGRGMDFDEVRIYQPGDDIRSIDWRVTARTAKTHTKIFREEKERPVLLAVDQSPSMFFGSRVTYKSVMATALASLLAWSSLEQQDKIGGIIFNQQEHAEIKPKRSKHALLGLLKLMVDFNHQLLDEKEKKGDFSIHQLLEKIRFIAKPGSTVYLISDFLTYDEEAERLLYLIKRHTDVYSLVIADKLEECLPLHERLNVTDGIQKISLNTFDKTLSEHYQQSFHKRQEFLSSSFRKLGVIHQYIWTHDDPYKALVALSKGPLPQSPNITLHDTRHSSHHAG